MAAFKNKDQLSVCGGDLHVVTVVSMVPFLGKARDINGCPEVGTPSAPRRYWKLPYLPFLVGYKSSQVNSPNFHDYILVDVHIHINSHSNSAKKVINRFVIPPYNKGMTTMWANICSTYMCDGSILHSSHFSFWTTFEVHCMNGI